MIRKMVETDLVQVVDLENICFPIKQNVIQKSKNPFDDYGLIYHLKYVTFNMIHFVCAYIIVVL